jgi:hypothetical protein
LSSISFAREIKLLELDEVSIGYRSYIFARDPLFVDTTPNEQLNSTVNFRLMNYIFVNTFVHGTTNKMQYKRVGLLVELGVHLFDFMDLSYTHHSQHLLDSKYPYMGFPVEDSVGIRLILYRRDTKDSIL